MHVRTDDDVYRVDAVWLGPPRATFPWRARYVSYGVGFLVMLLLMFVQRRLGIDLTFFSVAWALVGTVAITRLIGKKVTYERPFGQVVTQFWAEVTGPRARTGGSGGSVRAGHVRVRSRAGTRGSGSRVSGSRGSGSRGSGGGRGAGGGRGSGGRGSGRQSVAAPRSVRPGSTGSGSAGGSWPVATRRESGTPSRRPAAAPTGPKGGRRGRA